MSAFKPWDHVRTPDGTGFVIMALPRHVKVRLYSDSEKRVVVYKIKDVRLEPVARQDD
jgi:hypothetical protein